MHYVYLWKRSRQAFGIRPSIQPGLMDRRKFLRYMAPFKSLIHNHSIAH
ncbi:hypothetical protein SynROS8604_01805 [Synechococcus sp. ROS8604]|nr:hypothetical protein SynROS8604_01805 [Synechococcus sp. ROS8604]